MTKHLQREIDKLKKMILALSAVVEEGVYRAVKAIGDRDAVLARKVLEGDREVDQMEVEVEEECLKALALHQPVAIDLRFIIAVLKINNDLERIGDLSNNIAWRAEALAKLKPVESPFDFHGMATKVKAMLSKALEALVNLDPAAAQEVMAADDEVDAINRDLYQKITGLIRARMDDTEQLIHYFSVSRNLERIADHATNIAEDVLYMIEGEIFRHGHGQRQLAAREAERGSSQA